MLNHPAPPSADDISLATNRGELAARCTVAAAGRVAFGGRGVRPRGGLVWKLAKSEAMHGGITLGLAQEGLSGWTGEYWQDAPKRRK